MIDIVNGLGTTNSAETSSSTGFPGSGGGADPIGQIEAILNAHLGSLQWIDGAVKELEGKVHEVESKHAQHQGPRGYGLGSSDSSGTDSPGSSVYGGAEHGARRGFGLGPVRR